MKNVDIRFFLVEENKQSEEKKAKEAKSKKVPLTGYISGAGKLVVPLKTAANLDVNFDQTAFKVGMQQGKLKAKSLYLVPVQSEETDTFQFEKAAKSYTLLLPVILKKSKIDFTQNKYAFTIEPFDYKGATALEFQLSQVEAEPKSAETGKKRGPKLKQIE